MIQELHKSYKAAADAYRKAYEVSETDTEQHKESLQSLARVYQCMNWFSESQQLYIDYKKQYEWNADIAYDYAVLLVRMDAAKDAVPSCFLLWMILPVQENCLISTEMPASLIWHMRHLNIS